MKVLTPLGAQFLKADAILTLRDTQLFNRLDKEVQDEVMKKADRRTWNAAPDEKLPQFSSKKSSKSTSKDVDESVSIFLRAGKT